MAKHDIDADTLIAEVIAAEERWLQQLADQWPQRHRVDHDDWRIDEDKH